MKIKRLRHEALYHAVLTILKGYINFPDNIKIINASNILEADGNLYYVSDDSNLSEDKKNAQELADFLEDEILFLVGHDLNSYTTI